MTNAHHHHHHHTRNRNNSNNERGLEMRLEPQGMFPIFLFFYFTNESFFWIDYAYISLPPPPPPWHSLFNTPLRILDLAMHLQPHHMFSSPRHLFPSFRLRRIFWTALLFYGLPFQVIVSTRDSSMVPLCYNPRPFLILFAWILCFVWLSRFWLCFRAVSFFVSRGCTDSSASLLQS